MQKAITVFLDETPWFQITVTPGQTIEDIKSTFGQNRDLRLKMFIGDNEYPVMETSQYNKEKINPIWNSLDKARIVATRKHITRVWTKIPDIDKKILISLNPRELANVCLVDNYIANLCRNKNFWRNKIARDFPLRGKFIYTDEYRKLYQEDPQSLYKKINEQSKMIVLSADSYPALAEAIQEDDLSPKHPNMITEAIRPDLNKLLLLRGDVIYLEWLYENRNNGKFLWDGEKVVNLLYDYSVDEYGTVPSVFTFPEFPLDHFFNTIDHNNIIWLSPQTQQELQRNFKFETFEGTNDVVGNVELFNLRGSSIITDNFGIKYRVKFYVDDLVYGVTSDERVRDAVFKIQYLDIDDASIHPAEEEGADKQFNTLLRLPNDE